MSHTWNVKNMMATQFDFWLVFDKSGPMKMTRTQPKLSRTKRAVFMEVVLPNAIFETPSLRAKIDVADAGTPPMTFNLNAITDAVKQAVGLDIEMRVVTPDEPDK